MIFFTIVGITVALFLGALLLSVTCHLLWEVSKKRVELGGWILFCLFMVCSLVAGKIAIHQ